MTAYRAGYGTGLYGANVYGLDGSVVLASAATSASGSLSAYAQRKRNVSSVSEASLSGIIATRVTRSARADVVIISTLTPTGRRKWEFITPASNSWSDVPVASETWTEVA